MAEDYDVDELKGSMKSDAPKKGRKKKTIKKLKARRKGKAGKK